MGAYRRNREWAKKRPESRVLSTSENKQKSKTRQHPARLETTQFQRQTESAELDERWLIALLIDVGAHLANAIDKLSRRQQSQSWSVGRPVPDMVPFKAVAKIAKQKRARFN
jgi:hypothetical protein